MSQIKSKEYREFESQMKNQLDMQEDKLRKLAGFHEEGVNFFMISYLFKFPRKKYFTKEGRINKRCADVDNLIKPVNDQLFKSLAKHKPGTDDSSVVGIKALKVPHEFDDYKIIIEVKLRESLEGVTIY